MTQFTYSVTFDPSGTPAIITSFIRNIRIEDIGTDTVKNAQIELSAVNGAFITQTNAGVTPILDEYDKIEISIVDANSKTFDEVFQVLNLKPVQDINEGNILVVDLVGLEFDLTRVKFAKQLRRASGFTMTRDIIDFYNDSDSSGSLQPKVTGHDKDFVDSGGNELPKITASDYMFNISELMCHTGLKEIVDRLGAPVSAQGAGDFFELYFPTNITTKKDILFEGFSSGNPPRQQVNAAAGNTAFDPTKAVTISNTDQINPGIEEGGVEATRGTVIGTWGSDEFGSQPVEVSQFSGDLTSFDLISDHITGEFYPFNSFAKLTGSGTANDGKVFQVTNASGTTNTPPTDWTVRTFEDFTSVTQYSPWTNGKANYWKNCGSNPSGGTQTSFDNFGFYDCNMVVVDGINNRIDAELRSVTDNFSTFYKYGSIVTGQYRGMRILVDGTGIDGFAGNDKFGNPFTNNLAEYTGAEWFVKKVFVNGNFCSVIGEGKNYRLISGTWTDLSADPFGNDCFHVYDGIINSQGYNNTPTTSNNFGVTSAVEITYRMPPILSNALPGFNQTVEYYKYGNWANFAFPFPTNSHNSITLGELYGNNTTKKEPVTFDTNNMHLTHSGKIGFNNDESEELGSVNAIQFMMNFEVLLGETGTSGLASEGEYKFRCACYDTTGNVMIQDFIQPFNNKWEAVSLPLTAFQIYRARTPIALKNIATNILLSQNEITNVFRWENLKRITIQWNESYDDQGRYNPIFKRPWLMALNAGGIETHLFIDSLRFTKPLLSVSPPNTQRSLQPKFYKEPHIINKRALDQANEGFLDIENFPHIEYNIRTEGFRDILFGDSFFFKSPNMTNFSDKPISSAPAWVSGTDYRRGDTVLFATLFYGCIKNNIATVTNQPPNATFWKETTTELFTVKLVAKKIEYEISKGDSAGTGFIRKIKGVKRLES